MKKRPWLFALAIVLFGAIVSLGLLFKRDPEKEVQREMRAAGVPVTLPELLALGPQTGSDAGTFYKQHLTLVEQYAAVPGHSNDFTNLYYSKMSDADRDKLALKMRNLVGPTIQGAKCDRWVMQFANGKHMSGSDSGLDLLCCLAEADARQGRFGQAMNELDLAERIIVQEWDNPGFWSMYSGMSRESKVLVALEHCLDAVKSDADTLKKGEEFLKRLPPQPSVYLGLKYEAAGSAMDWDQLSTMDMWHDGEEEVTQVDQLKDKYWYGPKIRHEQARFAKLSLRIFKDLPQNVDWQTAIRIQDRDWDEVEKRDGTFVYFDDKDIGGMLLKIWPLDATRRRVDLAATRIQILRLKTGALPKALPDFGADGIDPFTSKPLHYKLKGSGFIVYGVGRNLTDDGGSPMRGADIVAGFE